MPPMTIPATARTSACLTTMRSTSRALRAERHPDADLLRPLGDAVRDDAVDSHRRQQQRRRGEDRQQQHRQPALGDRVRDHLVHRLDVGDDKLGIELANEADDRR